MRAIKYFVVLITTFFSVQSAQAQQTETYLGKIPVYKFYLDSLRYSDKKNHVTAVGIKRTGDLYSSLVGNQTFFKLSIDDASYAVQQNKRGVRALFQEYYMACLYEDGEYVNAPAFEYMAGPYLLELPFAKDEVSNANENSNVTSTSNIATSAPKQLDWQYMGKVSVKRNMRRTSSGGEDDVRFDTEVAFLYSSFDGTKTKYKISIPKYGSQYDVHENCSYTGRTVEWSSNGRHIRFLPSIDEMFTHYAGSWYLNVGDIRN